MVAPYPDNLIIYPPIEKPTLKDIIIESGCKVLAELTEANSTTDIPVQEKRSPKGFDRRRSIMLTGSPGRDSFQNNFWLRKTKAVMKEMNAVTQCIPSAARGSLRFLDLGCCPGGFTAYILEKNKIARGLGISLPTEDGGHAYCLDNRLRRQTFISQDLTKFQLSSSAPVAGMNLKAVPRDIEKRQFDLAVLGASPLSSWRGNRDSDLLLVSQLVLGLQGVKTGGTIIVLLHNPESSQTARVLYLLDKISKKLTAHKPTSVHSDRSSFYAIAQGVGLGKGEEVTRNAYLDGLRRLWSEMSRAGRKMVEEDLDFIVTMDEVSRSCVAWLVELCGKIWEIQLRALEVGLERDLSF